MTIVEAGAALRARKISSLELVNDCLARIERLNPKLNAFLTVTADAARARASAMDAELTHGRDRGPMHGIPIAHKDLIMTRGVKTTAGSKIFANFVPDHDAVVAQKLDSAGAVMVGKTHLHELAYGITSNNPHFGAIHNPWNLECITGGSSGGSGAAVAAGLVPMATGTDTGGSIRIPAAFCGTVGLKPTYERVSRRGVLPLGLTLDHIGPLAGTVRDTAISFNAMAEKPSGYVPPAQVDIRGLRIGLPQNFFFDRLDPEVAAAVRKAVQSAAALGARIVDIRVPDMDAVAVIGRVILLVEASAVHAANLHRRSEFGADVLALLDQGRLISGGDYVDAQRVRRILCREFAQLWKQVDCIFAPATPSPAPKIGQTTLQLGSVTDDVRLATTRPIRGINVLGIPALALPCGFSTSGLPIGMQIFGPPGGEDVVLRAGAAIEDVTGIRERHPVL
jgi:aspartyl-tRNA(Asn)/glutamyl-tRNA(Gln) amidotransferase subunit A